MREFPGQYAINLLLQQLTTKLFLSSSQHAMWLLSILHALLVQHHEPKPPSEVAAPAPAAPAPAADAGVAPAAEGAADAGGTSSPSSGTKPAKLSAEQQSQQRWSKITKDMHAILSRESVLAICHFLCQAGSGHGTSGEGDTYQMAAEILVALTASREHLDMVRGELMQVLAVLVMDIEAALSKCEATTAEPSTMESRFLRVVRTLGEVFKKAVNRMPEEELNIEDFLKEARVETLWTALDRTLERLGDTEVIATPAQRLLASGVAPSAVRAEGNASGLSEATKATLASNVQAVPPKPLLNRLLPLIEVCVYIYIYRERERDR